MFREIIDRIGAFFRRRRDQDRGIEAPRSNKWPAVRRQHLLEESKCQWCKSTSNLEVHHIAPFHLHPELELEDENLITLCEGSEECHLKQGHLGDWKNFNPKIRKQCIRHSR